MSEPLIPDNVRAFLLQSIDSIAHLEALLLLRANPTFVWTAEMLAQRLYIAAPDAVMILQRLAATQFVTLAPDAPEQYRYQPTSADLAQMVDQVASLYSKYLIPITKIIHAKPRTRVQEFADAFKWRKG